MKKIPLVGAPAVVAVKTKRILLAAGYGRMGYVLTAQREDMSALQKDPIQTWMI